MTLPQPSLNDKRHAVYDQVIAEWQKRLRDGEWLSEKALVQSTSDELCNSYLKTTGDSACDLPDAHLMAWARFEKDVLPRLLENDEDYEVRHHNGQRELRCCKSTPVVEAAGPIEQTSELVHTPAAAHHSVTESVRDDKPMPPKLLPPGPATLRIDQIQLGTRHRKDLGDIESLAASIKEVGLLHALPVTPDCRLIAGARRLAALKNLGRTEVPVAIVEHLDDAVRLLQAERDENECRKSFDPSEAVALGRAIEALERPQAQQRQRVHGGRPKKTGGKLPPVSGKGKTRDKAAQAVGMSGRTYAKAKSVVEAAEASPEQFGTVMEEMDATGNVDAAFQKVKRHADASSKKKSASSKAPPGKGTAKTLTITKPTTDDEKALATMLFEFLGEKVCQNVARAWSNKEVKQQAESTSENGSKKNAPSSKTAKTKKASAAKQPLLRTGSRMRSGCYN